MPQKGGYAKGNRQKGNQNRAKGYQKVTGKEKKVAKKSRKKKVSGPPPFAYPLLRHVEFKWRHLVHSVPHPHVCEECVLEQLEGRWLQHRPYPQDLSGSHLSARIASDWASRALASQAKPHREFESQAYRLILKTCRFFASQAKIAGFSQNACLAFSCDQANGFS